MRGKVYMLSVCGFSMGKRETYNHGQCAAAFRVNQEESRNGGHDLNSSISQRGIEGLSVGVANAGKNR